MSTGTTSAGTSGAVIAPVIATTDDGRTWDDIGRALREPFEPDDLEWRLQQAGEKNGKIWARALAYITSRGIMDRLDAVVGPGNWQDAYEAGPAGGVLCRLSLRLSPASGWVWKEDAAENTDVEAVKGGISSALKRVGAKWGVGRYLYGLDDGFARVHDNGKHFGKTKDGKAFRWDPPSLPDWALPKARPATATQLAVIERFLEVAADKRVVAAIRKRVAEGLTESAATDAIQYLANLATKPASQAA